MRLQDHSSMNEGLSPRLLVPLNQILKIFLCIVFPKWICWEGTRGSQTLHPAKGSWLCVGKQWEPGNWFLYSKLCPYLFSGSCTRSCGHQVRLPGLPSPRWCPRTWTTKSNLISFPLTPKEVEEHPIQARQGVKRCKTLFWSPFQWGGNTTQTSCFTSPAMAFSCCRCWWRVLALLEQVYSLSDRGTAAVGAVEGSDPPSSAGSLNVGHGGQEPDPQPAVSMLVSTHTAGEIPPQCLQLTASTDFGSKL